jgi:hypothetical protein
MADVGDRRNAGVPKVLQVGIAGCATDRENLPPANGAGPERRGLASENTELQAYEHR